jgi:hypothetical protein
MTEKTKSAPTEDIERRTVTREIRVELQEPELAKLVKEAGALNSEVEELDQEFAKVKETHDTAKKSKQEKIKAILRVAHNGRDSQTLECEAVYDWNSKSVTYFHDGKKVDERVMEVHELQREMSLGQVEGIQSHLGSETTVEGIAEVKKTLGEQVAEDIKEQTNKKTARSAADGPNLTSVPAMGM